MEITNVMDELMLQLNAASQELSDLRRTPGASLEDLKKLEDVITDLTDALRAEMELAK